MSVDLSSIPKTLAEWGAGTMVDPKKGIFAREVIWQHLDSFFREQGLILWVTQTEFRVIPPNNNERSPDGFAYRIPVSERYRPTFELIKPLMCPARTLDDRDVLIKLISKGNDGANNLEALRRLAAGNVASRGDNHTVPVLRLITLQDMTFAVFPLMDRGFSQGWYHQLHETIDAAIQLLEGLTFVHDRLVAHRDIDDDNILINFVGGPRYRHYLDPEPFRARFPVRYYLNDFEYAICFEESSQPSDRLVSGIPIHPLPLGAYGRPPAPEMLSGRPYCPFKCDIWQMGTLFRDNFNHISALPSEIKELYLDMSSEDPLDRPTAALALDRLRMARDRVPGDILRSFCPEMPPQRDEPIPGIPFA